MVTGIPKKSPPEILEEEPLEIPLEEEEPPIELTPEEVVRLPTTQTQDGWVFKDIAWDIHGEAINYIVTAPTGEEFTKAEYDAALLQQDEEPERLPEVISAVFPDMTLEGFVNFIETDFETFIQEMRVGGATEENIALLRQLGYPQEQIDAFYGVTISAPVPPQPPAGVGKFQLGLTKALESTYGTELVQEVATNLNKDYFDVSNEEVEAYIAANPDVAKRFAERQKEFPALTLWEEVKIGVQGLLKLPKLLGASILQAFQGQGGASVVDKDWADREIEAAQKDINEYVSEVQEEYGGRASLLGITATDIAQLPLNLAFSVTSMGAGLGVGLPILPFSRVGAYAAGTAASGYVAYQMTTYQIMQQYLELENEKSIAEKGRGITAEEEEQLKADFESKAHRYGLWEAIPEAISNLSFALLLTKPLTLMGLDKHFVTQIMARITGMYGQELLTETITQKGQSAIEIEAGLREGSISWLEAFKEIAPQTFLLTTVMAGAGQTIISSTNAIKKIRASLSTEIGETHPLYDGFLDEALKHYEETTIPFVKPPTITPTEAVVTPIPTEVPVTPAIEAFLATPDEQIIRPSSEVIDALEARGFSRDYITTKMSIAEMKQALATPVPAVPEVTPEVTKELQPLITEAKKYNTAEEFISGLRDKVARPKTKAEERISKAYDVLFKTKPTEQEWRVQLIDFYNQQVAPKPPAVEVAKPPVEKLPAVTEEIIGLPPPTEPISRGIAENTQGLKEITAKEEVRPSRKVFIKMGIWRDFYKPMSRAEALINEERIAFGKERREINKLIGKDVERRALVWDEVNKKGSVVGLTFDEKRAVARIREWADRWADRKNLPESKRIADLLSLL